MSNKKELKTNLISSFLVLLSCCLGVALLINLWFQQDCATVIVGMLGVCAALYAPLAAYFFYGSWKDQHNTEIEQSYINEFLIRLRKIIYIQKKHEDGLLDFYKEQNRYYDEDREFYFSYKEIEELRNLFDEYLKLNYEYNLFSNDNLMNFKTRQFKKDVENILDFYKVINYIISDEEDITIITIDRIMHNLNTEIIYDEKDGEFRSFYNGYYYKYISKVTRSINNLYEYILKEKVLAK